MGDSVTLSPLEEWRKQHNEVFEAPRMNPYTVGLSGIDPDRKQGPEIDEHKVRDWMRRMLEEDDIIDGGVIVASGPEEEI